ncbi:hypothetical protein J4N02_16200 [Propioniciclava sp. MC1595]|uniref:hypothetical protein n=1 Tax=Propioniciclava sp. MC1595 TaxID=2760308 RepID=UPI0016624FA8|nr:hypothetical protein [Propioniciclava sp. MC1595]MBB1496478.1 hypothetical protein [Propioniciclava sp. MC1595]QTE25997.1 hypothetical protein J4N02_16200 [Propioniciclava sp. MC1595]
MSRFKKPTPADVRAVLLKVPTLQLRRVFYSGLQNPHWVQPLSEAGAFSSPPEPQMTADGYVRDLYWPELSYLIRMATVVPTDVVDVLLGLKHSNNAWVRRAVFEIGARIPAREAARLRPLLEAWETTGFGWRTDPRELVSFAVTLLEGGETKTGRWVANLLFEPRAPKVEGMFKKPHTELEDYWYQEELPRVLEALGEDALKAVTGWLAKYAILAGHSGQHDFSGMMRPSIRDRGDLHPDAEQALVDAVRDLAVTAMPSDPEATVETLLRPRVQLLRKIALFAAGEALRKRVGEPRGSTEIFGVAERLLGDIGSHDMYLRVEYAELAQAVAKVKPESLSVINDFIDTAYAEDLESMRERLTEGHAAEGDSEAQITERADRYKHNWLSAIGAEALPPQARDALWSLDARFGVIEEPMTPLGMVTSWIGPNPYLSQDEMALVGAQELVALLSSWRQSGNRWGPEPSHEGQGRELSAFLTTNPLALSGEHDLTFRLRPTYLRAILRGWEAALKADLELDWEQVADLVRDVLEHENDSAFPVEGSEFDDDRDFRGAKRAAVGLLNELVKVRKATAVPPESMQRFAELLIVQADDEDAWAEYDSHEQGEDPWDPLTMSINWQWPERLRGLFHLALREEAYHWRGRAFSALERELGRPDRHGASAAVIGESFGRIYNHAPEWLDSHLEEFFGSAEGLSVQQQIALTTAMAMHYYHRELYNLLTPSLLAAIELGDGLVSGWRTDMDPRQRIGEWVIDAIILGHQTIDDPVAHSFFTATPPSVRGEAIGKIAWSFFRAETVDDAVRDRFASFLDDRIAHVAAHHGDGGELSGMYWIAKGGKFPVEWWLPRLRQALEFEPSIATERYMIGSELAEAATVDPKNALAVLQSLLSRRDQEGMVSFDLMRKAVPTVIAAAIRSGDDDLRKEADRYMNELGAAGNLGLEAEVHAILQGKAAGGAWVEEV